MKLKFDMTGLFGLLTDFYTITGIRIVVFDDEFNKIAAYPENSCNICTVLKQNPESKMLCKSCDRLGCLKCKDDNKMHIYTCHAGLCEAAAPIRVNDLTIGYMMFGQITDSKAKAEKKSEVIDYCSKYFDDKSLLASYYDTLVSKTKEEINAAAKIMESCALYLWINQLVNMDTEALSYQIDTYIDDNLKNDLSVGSLCHAFGISRSKLFDLSKRSFGMSISRYIRKKRMSYAAHLLSKDGYRVREAAEACGFSDYNHFSKVFKAEMGSSPLSYRKKITSV